MRTRSFVGRLARAEPGLLVRRGALHDVRRYAWIRGRLTADRSDVPAAPGYCHDYLALIDERWRGGLERIYDSQFERSAAGEYPVGLAEIQTRIERITEPLLE
jgi:hypothetical protein